ncbi:MAG: DUF2007 domain-containing protein [Flavobacteriales bacterium]|nr:DUF2007 domain-containing protein [Flavobacteriales bacterium]
MNNWAVAFTTGSPHEAEIVKGLLESHGFNAVVMDNGSSSAYPQLGLGDITVLVEREHLLRAMYILQKNHSS